MQLFPQEQVTVTDFYCPRFSFGDHSSFRTTRPTRQDRVAVLGAGHGGLALAGYLSAQGHRVSLWNRSSGPVASVSVLGGIRLTLPKAASRFASIEVATPSMRDALVGARVILVAVPASAHADIARECAPFLRDGQTILLLPGRTGGALEFLRVLRGAGCRANIILGEANTFPFAARCVGPAQAVIFGKKSELLAAAVPANRTSKLIAACRPFLPMIAPASSALETSLANIGAILHPTITLLNAERISRGDSFDFYAEGVTPAVAAMLEAADAERMAVARAYGVPAHSLVDWVAKAYGHRAQNVREALVGNPAYTGIKAPVTLEHRYLSEDVPTGLIPLLELGNAAGLKLPTLRRLVDRARSTLGGERWHGPRTLEALGLTGLTIREIQNYVWRGSPGSRTRKTHVNSPILRSLRLPARQELSKVIA